MNVAGENVEVTSIDGIGDFLATVSVTPRLAHGFRDLLGRDEVFLHQREIFTRVVGQQIVHRLLDFLLLETKGGGTISLRVQIDEQDLGGRQALSTRTFGQGSSDVDGRGGFGAPTFLVRYSDDHLVGVHGVQPPASSAGRTSPFNAGIKDPRIRQVESREREPRRGSSERCACP